MAKRLRESELERETSVPPAEVGHEICRVCGGGIVVDPADHRSGTLPHRRLCRKCGAEYGTTRPAPKAA